MASFKFVKTNHCEIHNKRHNNVLTMKKYTAARPCSESWGDWWNMHERALHQPNAMLFLGCERPIVCVLLWEGLHCYNVCFLYFAYNNFDVHKICLKKILFYIIYICKTRHVFAIGSVIKTSILEVKGKLWVC